MSRSDEYEPADAADPLRACRPAQQGFTLLELLVVLVVLGLLAALAIPKAEAAKDQARIVKAIGDIRAIQLDLITLEVGGQPLPANLAAIGRDIPDPWGRPYVYLPFPTRSNGAGYRVPPGARRDRFLVPINSSFDLYSMGRDGRTALPLTAAASLDDIVRANDGGFIGLAARY